jgi:hypothetical protein
MLKDEAGFIFIGFEFLELEGKICQLNIGNNGKKGSCDQKLNRFLII